MGAAEPPLTSGAARRPPHHIVAPDELREGLVGAGLGDVLVRVSALSHLMRFWAVKPAAPQA